VTTAIVVTYDSAGIIDACLRALAGTPTVVVDNASRDETVELVRSGHPEVRVLVRRSNGGYARAVNDGIRAAGSDDVLVVNPDVEVAPGAIAALEDHLAAHPSVGIAVPRLVYPDGTTQESVRTFPNPVALLARRTPFGRTRRGRSILADHLLEHRSDVEPTPVDWAIGAAMLVRRAAINAVGPMDRRFFLYGEDVDWCHRMWAAGWEVIYVPTSVMEHHYQRSSRRMLDVRNPATRHHWAGITRVFLFHPGLLAGRGPRRAPSTGRHPA
jgi:GT2 family glycosyltransferase